MKKLTVAVGVAAYNSERNIGLLLNAILMQNETSFNLSQIIVYSDASKDHTVAEAKKITGKKIKVIAAHKNNGFAYVVKYLLKSTNTDITVILNDDIKIFDKNFLNKIVSEFTKDKKVGLVSANQQLIPGNTFIEKSVRTSFNAYEKLRNSINNGNNVYNCDGKVLAFSKKFIVSMKLPSSQAMGNVDNFMYFYCLSKGYKFRSAKDAVVFGKCANNLKDYINFYTRINPISHLTTQFGDLVKTEYKKPKLLFAKFQLEEAIKNPLGAIFIFFSGIYISFITSKPKEFNAKWDVVTSSKF